MKVCYIGTKRSGVGLVMLIGKMRNGDLFIMEFIFDDWLLSRCS